MTSVNLEKTLQYFKISQSITYVKEYFYILFSTQKHIAQA